MQQLIIISLLLSLVPFSFSLLLDICFGKPAAEEFDRKAIFFFYSLFLAKRRLVKAGKFKDLESTYITNMNSKDPTIKHAAKMEYKKVVFESGREFFSWELGFGMCPVCTNVRISILFAFIYCSIFSGSYFFIFLIACFSNMYLLFYNKLKN